jgi:hypothetical protein
MREAVMYVRKVAAKTESEMDNGNI